MRVAALYDIHGNLAALDAVLAELAAMAPDRIVIGGDVVPGPFPTECLERLLGLQIPVDFIHGNGETATLAYLNGEPLDAVPEPAREGVAWVGDLVPTEHTLRYAAWPLTLELAVPEVGRVLFCHATPRNETEIFTRNTPDDRVAPILEGIDADLVVCGHTHMQFDRSVGGTRIVNAGSVGMPFGTSGAHWLLLDGGVELRRTEYDYPAAEQAIADSGFPAPDLFALATPPREEVILERFDPVSI